jgi:uncharacterized protein (TIGR02145 family)
MITSGILTSRLPVRLKKNFFTGLFLLLPFIGFSQGEFNNWYFGDQAGITFNSGLPVALTNGAMMTQRESVTVSDSAGNLLFYSDGFDVYNRMHQKMPNGSGMNMQSCDQHMAVVQKVDDDSSYYLFTNKYTVSPMNAYGGIRYSVINMRLDNGMGDIDPLQKNVQFQTADVYSYLMVPVRHQNNRDAWLLTITGYNSKDILAYLIDSSGLHSTPVVNPIAYPTVYIPYCNPGTMRVSPDGSLIVCPFSDTVGVFSFNASNGHVAQLFYIANNIFPNYYDWHYMEFSVDSKYLYVSTGDWPWTPADILQYDATKLDSAQFRQSEVLIAKMNRGVHFQRGPDGKIYGVESGVDSMCVINHPELQGAACDFQRHAIWTHYKITRQGLPDMLSRYFLHINSTGNCQGEPVDFLPNTWPPADSVHWNFGDPSSGSLNVSAVQHASHVYSSPGTYTVHLFVRHNDKRVDSTSRTIQILPGVTVSAGPDRHVCTGDSATFSATGCNGCSFLWTNITAGQIIVGTSQNYTADSAGMYVVTVTGANGCRAKDTVQLFFDSIPVISNPMTGKTICTGESTNIGLTSTVGGTMFYWTASLTSGSISGFSADSGLVINQMLTNNLAVAGTVTYQVIPKVENCEGSPVNIEVTVTPGDSVKVSITASDNNICAGTPVTFTANATNGGSSPVYQWKINAINAINATSSTYTYVPANGDLVSCTVTSSQACTTNNPASGIPFPVSVVPLLPVSVTVSPSSNPVCAGMPVTFTANATNGGSSPVYQWKINAINATNATNSTYTYIPANDDLVSCIVTSSETCTTNNPASGIPYPVSVVPPLPVSVTVSASENPFCLGGPVTFTATPVNGGAAPSYQWKVNGANAGSNSSVLTYNPASGDQVSCMLTSSAACITGSPATSGTMTMVVNTNLPAGITIAASENPFCPGTSVTFAATPTNGGIAPSYQWKVNGANAGTNSASFTCNPAPGDSVRCIITSNLNCVTGNPASSGKIILSGKPVPNVGFTNCFDTVTFFNAQSIRLKGGLPPGGSFSGQGVNPATGIFTPSSAGTGLKTITYSYSNVYACMSSVTRTILVKPAPSFICGSTFTDPRDNKAYPTVQIGVQCWMSSNLEFGFAIDDFTPQTDNCVAEKYLQYSIFYQWDELMRYTNDEGTQGFCPPGWHIPSSAEWTVLLAFYSGPGQAGGPMKDILLGNGFDSYQQGFFYLNNYRAFATGLYAGSMYWTSTASGSGHAIARGLNEFNPSVSEYSSSRGNAFSVRCIRDAGN